MMGKRTVVWEMGFGVGFFALRWDGGYGDGSVGALLDLWRSCGFTVLKPTSSPLLLGCQIASCKYSPNVILLMKQVMNVGIH